jgi:hypothetical protein
MKPVAIVLLALAAATTAGCAGIAVGMAPAPHSTPPPTSRPSALTRRVPCVNGHQRLAGPAAVRRFHAVAAVSCVDGERIYPRRGRWDVRVRRVSVGSLAALQRYFEQPDRPNLPKGGACLLVGRIIVVPTFVDAHGHRLVPRTPVDHCGEPLPRLPKVGWHTVSVRKLKLQVSAAALASHCAMAVKDVVAGAIGPLLPTSRGPLFQSNPRTLGVCVYRTEDFEVGTFVRGFALDPARTRRLVAALRGSAPSGTCANQSLFATVGAKDADAVWVELGGCYRVARSYRGYTLGSANASVVRAMLGG